MNPLAAPSKQFPDRVRLPRPRTGADASGGQLRLRVGAVPAPPGSAARASVKSPARRPVQRPVKPEAPAARQVNGVGVPTDLAHPTAERSTVPARAGAMPRRPGPEAAVKPGHMPWARLVSGPWPVLCVLAVQAVLSLRLAWSNTAFTDEALYLWAGHLQWAHWVHGTQIPAFPTYFSGAPVIYPPLGALADTIGGLTGARMLSLAFMLGATCLLWATTSRLFGKRAAFFAAALWALLAPTLKLGAFATFDPLSMCLLAASAWCAVRTGVTREFTRWTVLGAAAMVTANAAAYSSAIFDPVIIAVALLAAWPRPTAKVAMMRAASLGAYAVSGLILLATAAGGLYSTGIGQTVLSRSSGDDPLPVVLAQAAGWTAAVVIVAVAGTVFGLAAQGPHSRRTLVAVLTAAALLVPVEQARIPTH